MCKYIYMHNISLDFKHIIVFDWLYIICILYIVY